MSKKYSEHYRRLGLKISYYRKLRGLTQEQLADSLQINSAYVGHIEAPNIVKAISMDMLFNIADVLMVEPYKLITFDD